MSACLFCQIARGELLSTKIYEDSQILAFKDIHPIAPVHILIISKKHLANLTGAKNSDRNLLGKILLTARDLGHTLGLDKSGYKIIINNGRDSGQVVFHLHVHLIGGWNKKAGGFLI